MVQATSQDCGNSFLPGRLEGVQSRDSSEFVESRRIRSLSGAQAAPRCAKEVTQKLVQRSSTTPDARAAEARVKVAKLEKALEALEGTDGVEDAIKKAIVKAKVRSQEFHRSGRLVKLDAERESEQALLEEGRA